MGFRASPKLAFLLLSGCIAAGVLLTLATLFATLAFANAVTLSALAMLIATGTVFALWWLYQGFIEGVAHHQGLLQNVTDAVLMFDQQRCVKANRQAEVLLGRDQTALLASPYLDLAALGAQLEPEQSEELLRRHDAALGGTPQYFERSLDRADGSTLVVEVGLNLTEMDGGPQVMMNLRDISARRSAEKKQKQLEGELIRAQKLEAIGTLAGGVSHDFNNLLQAIQSYADLLLLELEPGQTGRAEAEGIREAATRGAELTGQLLTFSRKAEAEVRPVDLNDCVRRVEKLLARTVPKMIDIDIQLLDRPAVVRADPAQLEQVLLNLALNARDAMPDGGRLSITTATVIRLPAGSSPGTGTEVREHAALIVSDTGEGMSSEVQEHIFEPFFTTKAADKGTGLGLATVYGIVHAHRGQIRCESRPGEGTRFELFFPLAQELREQAPSPPATPLLIGGHETVLLVDDDRLIQDINARLLRRHGYRVVQAYNAEEALEIHAERGGEIDLVLLDFIMPGMGGAKGLVALRERDATLPIVVASGYAGEGKELAEHNASADAVLRKPYQAGKMLATLRQVLDQRAPDRQRQS